MNPYQDHKGETSWRVPSINSYYEESYNSYSQEPYEPHANTDSTPVYPVAEDRMGVSRKRPYPVENNPSSFYSSKTTAHHENLSKYVGDSAQILQEGSRKSVTEIAHELGVIESSTNAFFLPHTKRILQDEMEKINTNTNPDWLDVESYKHNIKIFKRVLIPPYRPNHNVVGKLMGVRGSTLRRLCQTLKCHVSICGSGSRKTTKEEEERIKAGDPRYAHLAYPLHAEISTTGPAHVAYYRLAQMLELLHQLITREEAFDFEGIRFEATKASAEEYENERNRGQSNKPSSSYQSVNDDGSVEFQEETEDNQAHLSSGNGGIQRGRGRGRGRGGFVPRGRGRGFLPRRNV